MNAHDSLSHEINKKIEELKDIEVAAYEKSKKKKDPDIDRNALKPRIPDEGQDIKCCLFEQRFYS